MPFEETSTAALHIHIGQVDVVPGNYGLISLSERVRISKGERVTNTSER